ncbi:type III toxin-antitoxin system ToxN/AbiQ family toxin [Lactobacillus jensenii]|jgi:hypothetical protein|nr:type III toxin-antitoxin system ToxN/AbiQ family toxin [Lactobacillus jensenii]MBQ4669976.1 hypothetical protein [Lactobacillus jensenii]MBW8449589.1 type III toxin-antitoxin system ToxN/AbiQ family toxin [Lactobacillus jensenii]
MRIKREKGCLFGNLFFGVLNINNMIPVKEGLYQELVFEDEDKKY